MPRPRNLFIELNTVRYKTLPGNNNNEKVALAFILISSLNVEAETPIQS